MKKIDVECRFIGNQKPNKMAFVLFFDTETTGLPIDKKKDALSSNGNWPDLVSISWSLCYVSTYPVSLYPAESCIKKVTYLIKPGGWVIPEESTRIHQITMERANAEGVPLAEVLEELRGDILESKYIVAHNMQFDKNVLFHAYAWRLGKDPRKFWPSASAEFCSLQKSKDELKLPARYPKPGDMYKMPRLDELYEATFHKPAPAGAHRADRDVEVLEDIVWARWKELFV